VSIYEVIGYEVIGYEVIGYEVIGYEVIGYGLLVIEVPTLRFACVGYLCFARPTLRLRLMWG
jgi:hypothetical protein